MARSLAVVALVACVAASLACISAAAMTHEELHAAFGDFVSTYGKKYRDNVELNARMAVFKANLDLIEEMNAASDGTVYAPNQFADMTTEEFRSKILMRPSPAPVHAAYKYLDVKVSDALPDSFDWRDKNAVSEVQDQGVAGSCWAFSTAGLLEGRRAVQLGVLEPLSVEQLVACDFDDCGVFGGWPYKAMNYLISAGGIVSNKTLGYCSGLDYGAPGACQACMPTGYNLTDCGDHKDLFCNATLNLCAAVSKDNFVATVKDWSAVSTNETEMQAVLVANGPLSVALDASTLQFYKSGVWNPWLCSKSTLDHAVLITGYGTDSGKDYWTVKNSWGPKWGESGYFRIVRGVGKCGINTAVTTADVQ
eukprot:Opistho-2@71793